MISNTWWWGMCPAALAYKFYRYYLGLLWRCCINGYTWWPHRSGGGRRPNIATWWTRNVLYANIVYQHHLETWFFPCIYFHGLVPSWQSWSRRLLYISFSNWYHFSERKYSWVYIPILKQPHALYPQLIDSHVKCNFIWCWQMALCCSRTSDILDWRHKSKSYNW